jgi:pyruvate formate lyase activating enzyme
LRIAGIQGLSLVDFPGSVAAVLFTAGCDFRCPFCHNPDLITISENTPQFTWEETVEFLKKRRKLVDGVAITGGEPMLFPDIVETVARLRQEVDLPIKIDTNGHHPETLKRLLDGGDVVFVAMDLKTAPSRYAEAAGTLVDVDKIAQSVDILLQSKVEYEFRTTVVPGLVDEAAVDEMGRLIQGAAAWAFQQFQNRVVFDEKYKDVKPFTPDKVRALTLRAAPHVKKIFVRGL